MGAGCCRRRRRLAERDLGASGPVLVPGFLQPYPIEASARGRGTSFNYFAMSAQFALAVLLALNTKSLPRLMVTHTLLLALRLLQVLQRVAVRSRLLTYLTQVAVVTPLVLAGVLDRGLPAAGVLRLPPLLPFLSVTGRRTFMKKT